jgi:hypothetical protein
MERTMKASLHGPDSPAWSSFLDATRHDFYHLPRYVEVSAREDGGEAAALVVSDRDRTMLLPLVLRPIRDGLRDAASPYGYPGPLISGTEDHAFLEAALEEGVRLLAEERIVSLFVRLHPLLNAQPPTSVGTIVPIGETVCVDLRLSPEEQWAQTRRNHRQQIRQAMEAGFTARVDDSAEAYSAFQALYHSTMASRAADAYYYFDATYFEGLRHALGDRFHLAVVTIDDTVTAAGVFAETCGIAQMHLTGHDVRFATSQPMKLLFHFVISWCGERGDEVLHLGGGRGGADDSLFHFKSGFSRLHRPFRSLRVVILRREYDDLVATCPAQAGSTPPTHDGPFPAYRQRAHL